MRPFHCLALALVIGPSLAASAQAGDGSTVTLQIENDWFARFANSDRHYTTGLRLGYLSGDTDVPDWLADLTDWPSLFVDASVPPVTRRFGVALSQSIFTPDDTETAAPLPDDRPYAAWLHLSLSLNVTHHDASGPSRQDSFVAELGVVGPYAQGEEVQNGFHDVLDQGKSAGWDNQLDNEPGINLIFERKWRTGTFELLDSPHIEADFIPYANASLGNVLTFAGGGGIVRFSTDLVEDFGPPTIRPGLPGSEGFRPGGDFGWYVFAGASVRAVARNIFLDGNTFGNGPSVKKEPVVGDFQAGFLIAVNGVRFAYTHVFRSPEFVGQQGFDQFGALSVSFSF